MYKVLMIGCGKIAGLDKNISRCTHGSAIERNRNLTIKGCIDSDFNRANIFADKFKCEKYTDLKKTLEVNDFNIISVCSPDHTHFSITKTILIGDNKPDLVFLEKPACQNINEYEELIKLSILSKTPIIVNHSRRFNTDILSIKDLLKKNKFGSLIRVGATYYNGWLHNGVHAVDTISFLLDEQITFDKIQNLGYCSYFQDKTFDINGKTNISKVPVEIKSIDERYYQLFEFDFWFSDARIKIDDFGNIVRIYTPFTNDLNERVLKNSNISFPKNEYTNIEFAYNKICESLESKDLSILENFTLQNSESTMRSIFQGMELSNNKF